MKKDREKKQKYSNITDAAIVGSTSEESMLYANANREHLSVLDKLEEISKRKINPNYINQNINQQAGFSAELKEQAHVNAQNILMKNKNRLEQYDNLSVDQKAQIRERFSDYATPNKNHELVDYVRVDRKGNVISNTLTQSKFVGRNGAECFEKFLSKDYEKYFENGVKMEIPKDFFGDFQKEANIKIKSLESQIAKQKSFGDFQKAAKLEEKLQKCKTIKANTRSASITKEEAIYARNHPTLSTAKDVANLSHQAGMNAVGVGASVSGVVSLVTNIWECIANGKDPKKALKHTAIATLKGGALSYDTNLKALRAAEMEKKRDDAKAYHSQVEEAVKKADAIIDQFQAIEKMAKLFTRQITKCDALFFSLSQDAIATMKKHNYDTSRYNQKEKDQLCVTVSTLSSLSAFLKAPIMDEHQKLNKKAKDALNLMQNQINALENGQESGHYNVAMIQSNQKGLKNL